MASVRAGQGFGDWVTTGAAVIGKGGNGEVWAVTADDGRHGAIKILQGHPGEEGIYRLGRFRDEISFLIAHPDFPGILPLLDSQVSADPSELSWYVMPVAVPILQALGKDPEPRGVVAAVAQIAGTLEALAAKGVAHRDIKPDNLFRLDGSWVIGDFGLVTYPEKDPLTAHGRKLGPTDYMAPEMRDDADTADPGPADVWALAKTLWVLLTGERRPLPGTHRPADAAYTLVARISFTFAPELDRLLGHATQIHPQDRVPITRMARELRACLAEPPEIRRPASLPELRARAAALTAVPRQHVSDAQERRDRIAEAWQELEQVVEEAGRELGADLTFDVRVGKAGTRPARCSGTRRPRPTSAMALGACCSRPGRNGRMSKSSSRWP